MTEILSLEAHRQALTGKPSPESTPGALAPQDRKRVLSECEAAVAVHFKGFVKLGMELGDVIEKHKLRDSFLVAAQALSRISRGKLWKDERPPGRGGEFYRSFSDYLDRRWAISHRHAYHLINAAQVVDQLCTTVHNQPLNERQVRPLVGLPLAVAQTAWDRATEGGRQPTAEEVEDAACAELGALTGRLATEDALKARQRSIQTAEDQANAELALEPEQKRQEKIQKLGLRLISLLAGDEDAISLQKGAMALASGKGGKRLHAAAEMVRGAMKAGKRKRAG